MEEDASDCRREAKRGWLSRSSSSDRKTSAFSVAVAGCGGSVETPPTTDAASDTATSTDSRVNVDTSVEDEGSPVNLYGAPADTGPSDGGGPSPVYGAAPDR